MKERIIAHEPRILCVFLTLMGILIWDTLPCSLAYLLAYIAIRHAISIEKKERVS